MLEGPKQNQNIIDYLINNDLTQNIKEPTRVCTTYYEKTTEIKCSETNSSTGKSYKSKPTPLKKNIKIK